MSDDAPPAPRGRNQPVGINPAKAYWERSGKALLLELADPRKQMLAALREIAKDSGKSTKDANAAYRAAMRTLGVDDKLPR